MGTGEEISGKQIPEIPLRRDWPCHFGHQNVLKVEALICILD